MENKLPVAITALLLFFTTTARASDLRITDMTWYQEGEGAARASWCLFTIQWDNAWSTQKNHDAAWVFLKFVRPGAQSRHAFIAKNGVKLVTDHSGKTAGYAFKISNDQIGFLVYPSERYRGKIYLTLRVNIDIAKTGNLSSNTGISLNTYGIEMVKIPAVGFFIGEADSSAARKFHTFYSSDAVWCMEWWRKSGKLWIEICANRIKIICDALKEY